MERVLVMARTQNGDSVLFRAIRIVEAFQPGEHWISVTELSQRAGLHLATASRLVAELVDHGWLERGPGRRVGLGVRLWEVASRASALEGLREAALPVMERLHQLVGHHVQLGVLHGMDVLFLERLSAPDAVVNYTRVAGRLSLHASSAGLVLLADADASLQERILAGGLPAFTEATPTDAVVVRRILAEVRRSRSVVCSGYLHPEAMGIAAPIITRAGTVAALSVVVPNRPDQTGWRRHVRQAAEAIAREIESPD